MPSTNHRVGVAVRSSISLAWLLAAGVAIGQSQEDAPADDGSVQEVVVTGSRIQRSDTSSVGPLQTLTSEDIVAAAPTSGWRRTMTSL